MAFEVSEHLRQSPTTGQLFTWKDGGLIHRNYYNNAIWKPALNAAGVESTRENGMHALRHYYASAMLDGGASIRDVAEYLGHADPGFTLRTYAHLMPASEDRARAIMDRALGESSLNEDTGTD